MKRRNYCQQQYLWLDRAYISKSIEKRDNQSRACSANTIQNKKGQKKEVAYQKRNILLVENKPWVLERINSWDNRFRKLLARYEKKVENYLGLVQLSCSIVIYRKIISG